MGHLRTAAKIYANNLVELLPDGADKTYALRKLREVAMWANMAVLRQADGAPRAAGEVAMREDYPVGHPVKGDLGSVPL